MEVSLMFILDMACVIASGNGCILFKLCAAGIRRWLRLQQRFLRNKGMPAAKETKLTWVGYVGWTIQ